MTEAAVLDWVNTFDSVSKECSLSDLCSGQVVGLMLSEIEPDFFGDLGSINDTSDNWALSASNIKKILRKLGEYFRESLHKGVDMAGIDANVIAKGQDPSHIISLLELVIGAAVLCDNKAEFIPKIFSLNPESQAVLKDMVEHAMGQLWDLDGDESQGAGGGNSEEAAFLAKQLKEAQELIQSQATELQEIRATFQEVVTANSALKQEVEALKEKEFQREVDTDSDRSRAEAAANVQSHMKVEMEELRNQVSELSSELESLQQDSVAMSQRLEENEQIRTRLEVEALQMADELDIAREKSIKLTKAEATIAKYQTKMEEMTALKNQSKEMEATMDKYLEQIHELETANKSATSTSKMVEKYKDKTVVLERERFEAVTELKMKEDELVRVRGDLDSAQEAKRFLEEELASVSAQLEVAEAERTKDGEQSSGFGVFETPAALKEKIKQLELDLRVARRETASAREGAGGGAEGSSSQEESDVAVDMLKAELEETRAAKKEREDSLLATKRLLAEAQHDLKKALAAQEEAEKASGAAAPMSSQDADRLRETEQQLAVKANTLKHLEELLKESETKLNKAEHDKEKLEIFAKRSLTNFKDKYMAALQRYKSEKTALEVKLQAMTEKMERDQEKSRREERLMLSAVYEIGVQTMERSINLQIHETASTPSTFLSAQRADQERRLNPTLGGNSGTPTTTPIR